MMVTLQMLWLPILISALFVFVVSSLIHMFLPWHKKDYRKVPDEDKVMDALRPLNIPQGDVYGAACLQHQRNGHGGIP